jgi:hypothetical protein
MGRVVVLDESGLDEEVAWTGWGLDEKNEPRPCPTFIGWASRL